MTDHELYRELSAGYVLGALAPDDRRRFAEHLDGCELCRDEVASFAPIPALLARVAGVPTERLSPSVVDEAARRAGSEWAAVSRSRTRWRVGAVAALLAAIVATTAALLPDTAQDSGTRLVVAAGPTTGEVSIDSRAWGTAVHLDLNGLPQRDRYIAWVVDTVGTREQAATWGPTPAGRALLRGASALPIERVAAVVVTDGEGRETLLTAAAG